MKKDKAKTAAIVAAPIIGVGILGNILLGGGESISEPNETNEQIVETSGESENSLSKTVPETMSELYNPFEEESEQTPTEIESVTEPYISPETEPETEPYIPPEIESETEPYIPPETEPETEPYIPPETESETEPYIPPETKSETELYIPPETESATTAPIGEEMQWVWDNTAAEAETFSETEYYSEPETYANPEPFTETEPYYEPETYAETEPEPEPETEPMVTVLHSDSSMTAERISELEEIAYFWAPSGNKVHINPDCRTFQKGYVFAGTLEQAESVRTEGFCGICSKSATRTGNIYATIGNLEKCYTYEDFSNGIPAEAFE